MTDSSVAMESQEYEEVPEEVVETSYMCGECFLLFPTTEDFSAHQCQITEVDVENVDQDEEDHDPRTSSLDISQPSTCVRTGVWEAGESEAAMEEAVASILGERMKRMAPQRNTSDVQFDQAIVPSEHSIEHTGIVESQMEPVVEHTVENTDQSDAGVLVEGIEIPSANVYMYDNPVYLNRLMKDNTFGRRVRHDAPYSHRLGPWDNKSSRLLIQLLKEYPKAYFILDKECKRTEAWEMIRIKLAEAGYQFTVLQIRMRWRELCKKYRNTVNHNDLYGSRKTCQYFEDLSGLFGNWDRPATLLLIRQLEANGSKRLGQNGGTRMRYKVWEHIRQVLLAHGYQYTADQVQGRWSTLVTLYQRMVEHNSKPHNEQITVAYKDHIERVFKYVPERNSKWLKIMEKRGKKPKSLTKKWTVPIERMLLKFYHERVYRFNNEHVNNITLWQEIVLKLEEEAGYITTLEKTRTRFYELTKQFSTMEQHNAQPGTIRRECRHHETLAEIYSIYSYWPHDRSTIKLDKSNAIRMRQVNAQLAWSQDESRTLLQLYPQVLVAHLSSGDHQPIEELWLQLAKAYLSTQNDRKQCYEIEEHISLLRRGYRSQNPFPYVAEMQLLEETELTLGFTPDPLPIESDQLVPYWSHTAAHLLLDFVVHHRQEGVKNSGLFEMVSRDLAGCGYRYTGEECRVYYSLLRQLYTNRMRTIKRNKELLKPFPYMDKMAEVDAVVSQPRFVETEENRLVILSSACTRIEAVEGDNEDTQRDCLVTWLTNLKMHLKREAVIHPPPSVKYLARTLAETIEASSVDEEFEKIRSVLGPHLSLLNSISERGGSSLFYCPSIFKYKGKKIVMKKSVQSRYGSVQWTENNIRTMLNTIKEWRLLCHDDAELELMLGSDMLLWKEVASRLSNHYKVDPNKCLERFSQLCREYKSVISFNIRLSPEEVAKFVVCQEILEGILTPLICHDAQLDVRDEWWAGEEGGDWSRDETLELLFTVRELWPGWPKMDWDMVSMFMNASGYKRDADCCQSRFQQLYNSYQAALEHNQHCGIKTRRRPPFYFKLKSLFGSSEINQTIDPESKRGQEMKIDEAEVLGVLVTELKKTKRHYCHSVPRKPLLLTLAQYLSEHFQCISYTFSPYQVWHLLVQLHHTHREAAQQKTEVPDQMNLGEMWQNHSNPLMAYGFHAVPFPGWQLVCDWSVEEIYLLIETFINWELQPRSLQSAGKSMTKVASEVLQTQGFDKTPVQCQDKWHYLVAAFRHGGYRQFADQLNLIHLLAPSLLHPYLAPLHPNTRATKNHHPQLDGQTTYFTRGDQTLQVTGVQSQSMCKEQSSKHSSKKIKVESTEMNVLTYAEEDLGDETNISGNVASYVQINVPQQSTLKQCHVQVSVDEMRDWGQEEDKHVTSLCETSFDIKEEPKDLDFIKTSVAVSPQAKNFRKNARGRGRKSGRGRGRLKADSLPSNKMKTLSSSVGPVTYIFHFSGESQEDTVQVEVLSVTESENARLVECRTVEGVIPTRTIKLHYPLSYKLPSGLTHMYIPKTMVHPDIPVANKAHLPHSSKILSIPNLEMYSSSSLNLSSQSGSKEESKEIESKENGLAEIDCESSDLPVGSFINKEGSEKWEVMKLLAQYSHQCRQEKTRLLNALQESHEQQTFDLKQILNVFQQLRDSL
ncbi:uncharacterized protein [Panulirus ornatus]|uniref:uncharacterized protein n=1 Tax=Panulirus ornatus TaxID=150431 RepID=UPI003A8A5246